MTSINLPEIPKLVPFEFGVVSDHTPAEMVWLDLETTGLYPSDDYVLEVGIIITDKYGREKAWFRSLILHNGAMERIYELEAQRTDGDKIVYEMHTKSGLLGELSALEDATHDTVPKPGEGYSYEDVEVRALAFLNEYAGEAKILPMCGSTINFDRDFAVEWLFNLHEWFHYRNIDITTLKNLCRMLNPAVYAAVPQEPADEKWHRPLQDLRGSIREYNFYRQNFLFES